MTPGPRGALALAVVLGAIGTTAHARSSERPAPEIVLPLVGVSVGDGAPYEIDAGPPAQHIAFFATWCRPCVDEIVALGELEARWRDRGYRLVVVAVPTRQSLSRLARFAEDERVPGRLVFDADGSLQRAFGVTEIPTHVVLDARGAVVLRTGTVRDVTDGEIERILDAATGSVTGP